MTVDHRVAVVGGSGFIGSTVARALALRGCSVQLVHAPRLPGMLPSDARRYVESKPAILNHLAVAFEGCDRVVNAGGIAQADSRDTRSLTTANAVLPAIVAVAASEMGATRFVHVSSAAVQGRLPLLDDSFNYAAFSEYSRSKVLGERLVKEFAPRIAVVYRPPSVHGCSRQQTHSLAKFAASRFSSVAGSGQTASPQALVANVGDAIAFLVSTPQQPPGIVSHPWEGLSASDVLEILGGKSPIRLPRSLARAMVMSLRFLGIGVHAMKANERRLEVLWFGQPQAVSWLEVAGWVPVDGRNAWNELGESLRAQ